MAHFQLRIISNFALWFQDENKESNNDKKFDNSSEELEIFKNQSQLKAFGVLAAGFGTFLYFKLQYDTDPSNFIGGN